MTRCRCGRLTPVGRWCCWVCQIASDGGWILDPWDGRPEWYDIHTYTCEQLHAAHDPHAGYTLAAWNAGSAPPPGRTGG